MSTYRVMFFKRLTNSYGKAFDVCQRTIDVHSVEDPDRAVEEAKRRFEGYEDIAKWFLHADYVEVDALSAAALDALKQRDACALTD
jgi:hypothetical protein